MTLSTRSGLEVVLVADAQMGRMGARSSFAQAERGWIRQATSITGTADEEDASNRRDHGCRRQSSRQLGERCQGEGEEGGDEQEAGEGLDDRHGECKAEVCTKCGADEQETEYLKRPEVKIVIPDVLKLQLVDDWENVTKNNQVSCWDRQTEPKLTMRSW